MVDRIFKKANKAVSHFLIKREFEKIIADVKCYRRQFDEAGNGSGPYVTARYKLRKAIERRDEFMASHRGNQEVLDCIKAYITEFQINHHTNSHTQNRGRRMHVRM